MTDPTPPPRGPRPAQPLGRWDVGSEITVYTFAHDRFTGVVTCAADEYMILTGDGGALKVWTGSITRVDNHRPHPPRR